MEEQNGKKNEKLNNDNEKKLYKMKNNLIESE